MEQFLSLSFVGDFPSLLSVHLTRRRKGGEVGKEEGIPPQGSPQAPYVGLKGGGGLLSDITRWTRGWT